MVQKPRVIAVVVMLTLMILTKVISASTFVSNTTPSNRPTWLSPGWRFTAQSDTSFGESVCVEVHPQGNPSNYVRTECSFAGGSGPYDWQCDVFSGGVSSPFQSSTVEYQFFNDSDANNCGGGYNFTGFNWTFQTGPTAVNLRTLTAQSAQPATLITLAVVVALLLLGGITAVFRPNNKKGQPKASP